jgi:hypothetical protein
MNLEVRIPNELRGRFLEVRILQELANRGEWVENGQRREIIGDLMRRTRESVAREYRLPKCYASNGKYSDASSRRELSTAKVRR